MDERNQALPHTPPPVEPAAGLVAPVAAVGAPATSAEPETPAWPARAPDALEGASAPTTPGLDPGVQRGLWIWLLIILVVGAGGAALGQAEAAMLAAFAGLFITAQAADLDVRWRWFYWLLTWMVPVGGAGMFIAVGSLAMNSALPQPMHHLMVAYCWAAAVVYVLLALRRIGDPIAVRLFHEDPPSHSTRLSMRLALGALMFAVPGVIVLRDQIDQFAGPSGALITREGLAGQLLGMVLVGLAAVGFLVRRNLRQTLDRLGLAPITLTQLLFAAAGAGALMLFNAGTEQVQRAWFPALWAQDRAMNALLTQGLGTRGAVLLGVSAGVGEEITIRGALQPRLGLLLSSALFASLHVQYSWFGMLVVLAIGLLLGTVRARTSTTVAIALHAFYDIIAVVTN